MLPITAYPMATSDKSGEFEALQNAKLLRAEQQSANQVKGAQALGSLTGSLPSAIDASQSAGLDAEKRDAGTETLDWLYKEAPNNSKLMKDYAKRNLELEDSDMAAFDPMIRAVMQQSKQSMDAKPIYEFYKQIDDMKTAKDKAKLAKETKAPATGTPGIEELSKLKERWKAKNGGTRMSSSDALTFMLDPGNTDIYANWKKIDEKSAQYALTTGLNESKLDFTEKKNLQDIAKNVESKTAGPDQQLIAIQMSNVSELLPKIRKSNENLRSAVAAATPAGKNTGSWMKDLVTRASVFFKDYTVNSDEGVIKSLVEAGLPKDIEVKLKEDQTAKGPLWQMLITHLKNTSGAAVTASEYARFADAIGLSSASPDQQEASLAYFLGTNLAAQVQARDAMLAYAGDADRGSLTSGGFLGDSPAEKAISKIKAQADAGNTGAKQVYDEYQRAISEPSDAQKLVINAEIQRAKSESAPAKNSTDGYEYSNRGSKNTPMRRKVGTTAWEVMP